MDRPMLVLPTPGGPAKQMIFPANNEHPQLHILNHLNFVLKELDEHVLRKYGNDSNRFNRELNKFEELSYPFMH